VASIHQQAHSPNWFAAFSIYDAETNRWKRVFRSTKTSDKKQALEIMRAWDKAARKARTGKLTPDAARAIVAQVISDIFLEANTESLPNSSIKAWCDTWLEAKEIETEESTHKRYAGIITRFLDFLGDMKSKRDLETLQTSDIGRFRDHEAKELSRPTANLSVRVVSICLTEAVRQRLLTSNPAMGVKLLKSSHESKRRPFTLAEIQRILKACGDDSEWKGMVLFGLYLGQRLSDVSKLTWRSVNLATNEIAFVAKKTGRRIVLPLMPALVDYLCELPSADNPNAHIFPKAAKQTYVATLSNQFRDLLIEAGLLQPRDYNRTNTQGRSGAREPSEISFHSLRHTTTSMLKAAGVNEAIAMEIIGHETEAISRHYTKFGNEVLPNAMAKLPDVSATSRRKTANE